MAIPHAREEGPPPPLPPPRNIGEELSDGKDPGWQWGNTGFGGNRVELKPGSSLLGGYSSIQARHHDRREEHDFSAREHSNSVSLDDMSSAESLEHSDEDRSGKPPRPILSKYRYVTFSFIRITLKGNMFFSSRLHIAH